MDLRNCGQCGKVYVPTTGGQLCPKCAKSGRDEYDAVRTYIREHPAADILTVSEATGVAKDKILEYLREGRLVVASAEGWGLTCDRCDAPVTTGRFCPKCAAEIHEETRPRGTRPAQAQSRFGAGTDRLYRDPGRR